MINQNLPYSLLTIVVNRGKGSKILQFAREHGASDASCFYGKGTIRNQMLQMIEMNDVNKEIILIIVPTVKENEILEQMNQKFHFDKQNHGIAFTLSLAGVLKMKRDDCIRWKDMEARDSSPSKYTALYLIVNKGKAETVIEISQNAGYYGGTVIKARGAASKMNLVLDMIVEPEKEAVLIITESERVGYLASLLSNQLKLSEANTGILAMADIDKVIGLFQADR